MRLKRNKPLIVEHLVHWASSVLGHPTLWYRAEDEGQLFEIREIVATRLAEKISNSKTHLSWENRTVFCVGDYIFRVLGAGTKKKLHEQAGSFQFDPAKIFCIESLSASKQDSAIVVQTKFKTLRPTEWLSLFKAFDDGLVFASPGWSSSYHLDALILAEEAKTCLRVANFATEMDALNAIARGAADFTVCSVESAKSYVDSNRVAAFCVVGQHRYNLLPEVPTAKEIFPDYDLLDWYAILRVTNLTMLGEVTPLVPHWIDHIATLMDHVMSVNLGQGNKEFQAFLAKCDRTVL